jgi:hypothetical protein
MYDSGQNTTVIIAGMKFVVKRSSKDKSGVKTLQKVVDNYQLPGFSHVSVRAYIAGVDDAINLSCEQGE